jgi:protein disulfide-isomerase A1
MTTRAAVEYIKDGDALGASGFMIMPPMVYKPDERETEHWFRTLAAAYKGKLVFATSDGSEPRLNQHVGIEKSDMPKLLILETGNQMRKFPQASGDVTEAGLKAHIDGYLAGSLKPFYKSEKAPENNNGPVTIITGSNFNDIVLDPSKDVLLEVYAPWCGHCKKLEPIWNELGAFYAKKDSIVIAKMDGTGNEVDVWSDFCHALFNTNEFIFLP